MIRRALSVLGLCFILLCLSAYPVSWNRLIGVERLAPASHHCAYVHSGRLWVNGINAPTQAAVATLTRVDMVWKDRHPRHHYAAAFKRDSFGWDYYVGLPLWIPAALVAAPMSY